MRESLESIYVLPPCCNTDFTALLSGAVPPKQPTQTIILLLHFPSILSAKGEEKRQFFHLGYQSDGHLTCRPVTLKEVSPPEYTSAEFMNRI